MCTDGGMLHSAGVLAEKGCTADGIAFYAGWRAHWPLLTKTQGMNVALCGTVTHSVIDHSGYECREQAVVKAVQLLKMLLRQGRFCRR